MTDIKTITFTYTKEEAQIRVMKFMEENYGPLRMAEDQDKWLLYFGILSSFIIDLFPE